MTDGHSRRRRATMMVATALAFGGLLSSQAAAAEGGGGGERTKLSVDVSAQRFVVEGDRVVARGPVEARVVRPDGTTETLRKRVALKVKTTQKCQILELRLAKLYLNLLGLQVRSSEINLRVTGDSKRTLGKIFCDLSEGLKLDKSLLAKRSARSLNRRLDDRPLPVLSFKAPLRAQEQESSASARAKDDSVPPVPPGSCEILDLILGPLHLDLLGLVVDLYGATPSSPVRVLVTADPNGGAVGSSLCKLAGPSSEPPPPSS